jgi:hypothetical protein
VRGKRNAHYAQAAVQRCLVAVPNGTLDRPDDAGQRGVRLSVALEDAIRHRALYEWAQALKSSLRGKPSQCIGRVVHGLFIKVRIKVRLQNGETTF